MVTNVNNRSRQPKGTSKGGQFAPETHTENPDDLDTTSSTPPDAILRYPNGNPKREEWLNSNGELDRTDGPAIIAHREDGTLESEQW